MVEGRGPGRAVIFEGWGHLSTESQTTPSPSSEKLRLWEVGAGAKMLGKENLATVSREVTWQLAQCKGHGDLGSSWTPQDLSASLFSESWVQDASLGLCFFPLTLSSYTISQEVPGSPSSQGGKEEVGRHPRQRLGSGQALGSYPHTKGRGRCSHVFGVVRTYPRPHTHTHTRRLPAPGLRPLGEWPGGMKSVSENLP